MGLCTEHIKIFRTLFRATCTVTGYSQLNKQYTNVSFIVSLGTAAVTAYTGGCRLPGSATVQYTYHTMPYHTIPCHTIPYVSPTTAIKQMTAPPCYVCPESPCPLLRTNFFAIILYNFYLLPAYIFHTRAEFVPVPKQNFH